jgi:hypothetical protein
MRVKLKLRNVIQPKLINALMTVAAVRIKRIFAMSSNPSSYSTLWYVLDKINVVS